MRRSTRVTAIALACVLVAGAAVAGIRVFGSSGPADPGPAGAAPAADPGRDSSALSQAATGTVRDAPAQPPNQACATPERGPAQAPAGAVVVPAGDNSSVAGDLSAPGTVFWFAPGQHWLEPAQFAQIQPGDGASFIGAPGAILDGRRKNLYAFTGTASDVTIRSLTITGFGTGDSNNDQGVVNHDRGAGWRIQGNVIKGNDGAGLMIGSRNVVSGNCLTGNGQYGFSAFPADGESAVTDVVIERNEVSGNNTDDWEKLRPGCGCTGGGKLWQVDGARITANHVHDNRGIGIWADNDNRKILFQGNYFADNDSHGIEYEVSYNFAIRSNTFLRNAVVSGREFARREDSFPNGAIYISESGGDPRAGAEFSASEITGNLFKDNWDGVVLWENADRFCRPGEDFDTTNGCPWFDQTWGTRYRTQNVAVTGNRFEIDKDLLECSTYCGRQALFSNWGTYPENSPYKEERIQKAITFGQRNVWSNNVYGGTWSFVPFGADRLVSWDEWRAAPYRQDAGSELGS